jgi:GNAT superfamily N-acetyltransferase
MNMPDMLVKLYALPDLAPFVERAKGHGVAIRRAIPPEKHVVVNWVREEFGEVWASECEAAFTNHPATCFIATEGNTLLGFACHEATCKNFFGPTGVSEAARGQGIGAALLVACLHDMAARGYAYAIIGGVGPVDFYAQSVGAAIIEESTPGIYAGLLRDEG